jgi:hypothetical protein
MRLCEPDRASLTQGKGVRALGQRAFRPSPGCICGLERWCCLALPGDLERCMLRLWPEFHRPGPRFGLGTACAHMVTANCWRSSFVEGSR